MARSTLIVIISMLSVCVTRGAPASKDILSPRITGQDSLHETLTQLRQLLNDLEKEETDTLTKNKIIQDPNAPPKITSELTSSKESRTETRHFGYDDVDDIIDSKKDVIGDKTDDKKQVPEDVKGQIHRTDIKVNDIEQLKNGAMKKFLESLPDESVKDLEDLRNLVEEEEPEDEQKKVSVDDKLVDKTQSVDMDHAQAAAEKKAANWKDLMRNIEKQRDELFLQKQLKDVKDKITRDEENSKTYTLEGGFGDFTDEVKEAVEKNLLSDVALAIHSGLTVEEIMDDILGKNKAAIM